MKRSAVAMTAILALLGSMTFALHVAQPSAVAAVDGDPWTTMVVVNDPVAGEVLRHYRTGGQAGHAPELLGEVSIEDASEVVAEADGDAVWVLSMSGFEETSYIQRVAVNADGSLAATGVMYTVGQGARDLVRSPDDRHVYTVNPAASTLTAVDTVAGTVDVFDVSGSPIGLVVAPDGLRAAVITASDAVHVIDLVSGEVVATRTGGVTFSAAGLVDIELAPEGDAVYVAATGSLGGGAVTRMTLDEELTVEGAGDLDANFSPLQPAALEVDRLSGDVLVVTASGSTIERLLWSGSALVPVGNFVLNSSASAVLTSTALGGEVDVWIPATGGISRLEYPSGDVTHRYGTGDVRSILIMPAQPAIIDGPVGGSSNAGEPVEIVLDAVDPTNEVASYVWNFHDGSGLATTTQPRVEHVFDAEGSYTVTVRAVTRLGASVDPRFDGRSMISNGSPEAQAQVIRIVNPAVTRQSVTWTGAGDPDRTQKYWQIPERTTSLVITAAGRPGLRGSNSAESIGDFCEIVGESCSNPGADGGGRPTVTVTVPVGGGSDFLAGGDTLSIVLGHHGSSTHGQLLGGIGGSGGGTDGGDGGAGGGGSGVFLESTSLQFPWIVAAPGGGGGGGGGLSSFAGVGGAGSMGLSDAALGEGSGQTRGTYRAQCVAGETAFAQRPGGPSGQTLQNGDPGRSTDMVSTGGAGGGGGGCLGAAAGQEESPYPSGGAGGGGGIGYSLYPDSTVLVGEVAGADSFVGIEWTATAVTTEVAAVTAADQWRFAVGEWGGFPITFAGLGSAPGEPVGIPAGLLWSCVDFGANIPLCQIQGTPADGTAGIYDLLIDAEGGERTVQLVIEEPASVTADPGGVTWRTAQEQRIDLLSAGDADRLLAVRGELPQWLAFVPHGDGTASLVGTPPAGSDGTYTARVVVAQDARSIDAEPAATWDVVEVSINVVSNTDLTVNAISVPSLREGDQNSPLQLVVGNRGIDPSDPGATTVTIDTGHPDIVLHSLTGAGWSCLISTATCTRSGSLDAAESWPAIDVRVNVGVASTVGPWLANARLDTRLDVDVSNNVWTASGAIADVPSPQSASDSYRTARDRTLRVPESTGVLANDSGEGPLTVRLLTAPVGGVLELAENGSFTFRPNGDVVGPVRFTYRAVDRLGQVSAVSTATVVVDASQAVGPPGVPVPTLPPITDPNSPVGDDGGGSTPGGDSGTGSGSDGDGDGTVDPAPEVEAEGDRGFAGFDGAALLWWLLALIALLVLVWAFVLVRRRRRDLQSR